MVNKARVFSIVIGMLLLFSTLYIVWSALAPSWIEQIGLSIVSLFISIVIASICGEHFLKFLKKKDKNDSTNL
jgi:membrane protein implicated in regulation of membrane protease activity